MDRLVHTAMTAMRGAMARQTAIANNLANANTTGFRAEIANASTTWLNGPGVNARAQASEQVIAADMASGTVTQTGNPLDIALNGVQSMKNRTRARVLSCQVAVRARDDGDGFVFPDDGFLPLRRLSDRYR